MQRLLLLVEKGNYSERRAVTGLHLAAPRAGMMPASKLPAMMMRVAVMPSPKDICSGCMSLPSSVVAAISFSNTDSAPTPAARPRIPAMKVSRKLSERICDMMDHGRAPIARRLSPASAPVR